MNFKIGNILYYEKEYLKNIKILLKDTKNEKNSLMGSYLTDMIYNLYTVQVIEGHKVGLKNLDGITSYHMGTSYKVASEEEIKMVELKRMFTK